MTRIITLQWSWEQSCCALHHCLAGLAHFWDVNEGARKVCGAFPNIVFASIFDPVVYWVVVADCLLQRKSEALYSELLQTRGRLEEVELCRQQELLEAAANEKCTRVTLQEESTREKSQLKDQLEKFVSSDVHAHFHRDVTIIHMHHLWCNSV